MRGPSADKPDTFAACMVVIASTSTTVLFRTSLFADVHLRVSVILYGYT
jgi:hypothetical protein